MLSCPHLKLRGAWVSWGQVGNERAWYLVIHLSRFVAEMTPCQVCAIFKCCISVLPDRACKLAVVCNGEGAKEHTGQSQ